MATESYRSAKRAQPIRLRLLVLIAALAGGVLTPQAYALEGATSAYLKGYRDSLTGLVPAVPGVYFRDDVYFYDGSIAHDILQGNTIHADRRAGFGDLVVTPIILGWHWGSWHVNANTAIWIPIGSYNTND